jgi:pilin isopeptide linkage protein/LPXTG-motif cell wall-anchored protein
MPKFTEVTLDDEGEHELGPIVYDAPGLYLYEISQVAGDEADVSYDDTKYEVEVLVYTEEIDGEYRLLPQISGSMEMNSKEKVSRIAFQNEYEKPVVETTTAAETTVAETTVPETTRGGGGGGGDSDGPSGTSPSKDETQPATEPQTSEAESASEPATEPVTPEKPVYPDLPDIPLNPDGTPDIPEKTVIEIYDMDNPSEPVYRGPYSDDIDLPAGNYEIVMLDDEGVPLAAGIFTIDDEGVARGALPKTGDTSFPFVLLVLIMTGAAVGAGVLVVRIRRMDK